MKLLIMVLSSAKPPYNKLLKAQKETWDSIHHPNCDTVYYYGKSRSPVYNDRELVVDCEDGYYEMHWKFKKALDFVWCMDWDFIFRTNSSTYVNKERVYNYIKENKPDHAGTLNGNYIVGTNLILSRKSALILKDQLKENTGIPFPNEDMVIGELLTANNILPEHGAAMSIYNHQTNIIEEADCYRCKTSITNDEGREGDIKAFKLLYNKFK